MNTSLLASTIQSLVEDFDRVAHRSASTAEESNDVNPRVAVLHNAATYIGDRIRAGKSVHLMFVCTHNSRRSQFAMVWASIFAHHFGLPNVHCYSGGTEVTACNERTVAALKRAGFQVSSRGESRGEENPVYRLESQGRYPTIECHSSLFHEADLDEFAAMMCCAQVDQDCPLVPGAQVRIPLHYDDPKAFDGTEEESVQYDASCRLIARDMLQMCSITGAHLKDASTGKSSN